MRRPAASAVQTMAWLLAALPAFASAPAPGESAARDAWARATPPGIGVAAVYVTLVGGTRADRLVGAATPRAAMTQVHVVVESAGMVGMRETAGIEVPAGRTITLAPGGTHLMLMNLTRPLVAGERFPLTLRFESAGSVEVTVEVRAPGDVPPAAR